MTIPGVRIKLPPFAGYLPGLSFVVLPLPVVSHSTPLAKSLSTFHVALRLLSIRILALPSPPLVLAFFPSYHDVSQMPSPTLDRAVFSLVVSISLLLHSLRFFSFFLSSTFTERCALLSFSLLCLLSLFRRSVGLF